MSIKIEHPSAVLSKDLTDTIIKTAADAERSADLHPDQLNLIYKHGWFKMFIPAEYGGLEWSLPRVLRMEECISWADGSTGWVVTLCSGAGWFTGFLRPPLVREIHFDDSVCFAGSGAATGTANLTADGYDVKGFWKYASGSLHATVFTANCVIHNNGIPQYNSDGTPLVRAFVFHRDEVTLHHHWNSMGMIATASHSFEVQRLRIPAIRCFTIDPNHAILRDAVYQYPFLQLAETTLTVNLSGMAVRFLDLCEPIFSEKTKLRMPLAPGIIDLHQMLSDARAEMNQWRLAFYSAVERSWEICERGEEIPGAVLDEVSKASNVLAKKSRILVNKLYPYCGLIAADAVQEINRVWRNIHTAGQHGLFVSGGSAH